MKLNLRNKGTAAALLAPLAMFAGSAMASTPSTIVSEVTALIDQAKTDGATIAGGVTLMIFIIAAAKWLRRAK